eukprot:5038460-Pyramimonas_sp.AAC.1
MGFLSLFCVFFCWRRLIPFMIKLVEAFTIVLKTGEEYLEEAEEAEEAEKEETEDNRGHGYGG